MPYFFINMIYFEDVASIASGIYSSIKVDFFLKFLNALSCFFTFIIFINDFSMESVDQAGIRERFMQTNFESLSGKSEICNGAII